MSLLDYDSATGMFTWRETGKGRRLDLIAGSLDRHGYSQIRIGKKIYFAHRLAWLWCHGEMPAEVVDHIDGNPCNNAITNLRSVSRRVNQENQRTAPSSNKSTGLLGVSLHASGKYVAKIQSNRRQIYLGVFATPQAAHARYVEAKRAIHEGNTL